MNLQCPLIHMVVAKEQGRHLAFPDMCRLASGDLLVVYREGAAHVDPSGRIMMVRCADPLDGLAFTEPEVVCDTDWDDRDPSIMQRQDGTILVNFFQFDAESRLCRLALVTSQDGGQSWETPHIIAIEGFSKGLATSDAVVELPSGELIMPVYGQADHGDHGSYLLRSCDRGATWPVVSPLAVSPAPIFEEPALVDLHDGRLVGLLRTDQKGLGYLYQSVSADQGYTWSIPERLPLWGFPADIFELKDGRLLASYGYRQLPTGIRYCVTRKDASWSPHEERILRFDGHDDGELGYPSSVELPTGHVFTVYYFTDGQGGMPSIVGTTFQV